MTKLTDTLTGEWFEREESGLRVGGLPLSELADQYGTPLYVYDRTVLQRKLDMLRNILPAGFEVYYSVKANPNLAILSYFALQGCGLEVASAGEFARALDAGCSAERIVFAGPGKTESELEEALSHGVGEIHVESDTEASRIAAICRRRGITARVAVRVNPASEAEGGAMRMGGRAAPFGLDEEKLVPFVERLLSAPCFEFQGIHMFAGTQILDHTVLIQQYRRALRVARELVMTTGQPLATVDLGGGLGIPYFEGDSTLNLEELGAELAELIDEQRSDFVFDDTRFIIEPGRFLVGEAGIYIARVVDIKESRGKKFVILDGGLNHHLAASGNLGQTIKRNYPIALLERPHRPRDETVDIVGPLCTPLDTLGRNVEFPTVAIGDLVGVFQSGAYALTASPLGFLSHPSPAEVWVEDAKSYLIRARSSVDGMHGTVFPPSVAT